MENKENEYVDFVVTARKYKTLLTEKYKNRKMWHKPFVGDVISNLPGTIVKIYVEQGQEVEVSESVTPFNVNYMIEPAVAMSGLFKLNNRLKTENGVTRGIVKEIVENDRGFYVTVTFPEE